MYLYEEFAFLKEEIKSTIYKMKFKINRNYLTQRITEKKGLYTKLNSLILKTFDNFKGRNQEVECNSDEPKLKCE